MESSDPNDPHQTVEMTEFRCIDQNKTKHFKKYLKFTSENNEKRYRFMSISSEKDNFKVSENLLDRLKQFLLGYYALSLVYFSLYIVSYALDESSSDSLKFQLVLILVQGILNSFIYYYAFKTNLFNQARLEVLSLAYILAGISLILNNGPIQTLILDEKSETYISCLPGFLVLLTISPFVTHQTFLNYTFANSLIASIYLVLHCISDQKLSVTLFEFAIYVSRIIFEIFKFYKTEKDLRLRFLRKSQFNEIITITTRADPQNDLECINENLSECLLTLKAVKKSPNTIESRMTRMQELIKKVIGILKGNTNIYTTNIEAITKYMSEEDKLFIKQTWSEPASSNIFLNSAKLRKRDSDELNIVTGKVYQVNELNGILRQVGNNWNFDMFFLAEMTNNRPLLTLGKFAIGKYLLDEMLGVKDTIIDNFFNRLENQYNPNPYHNSTHAADVLSSLLYFVHKSSLYENLTDIDILASIVATLGHDNGHPGYTNRFLVNNRDNLAIEYNDVSVLEMMHCSSLFNIMKSLDADIFQNLSNDHYLTVRKLIIEMILATDMGKHFDLLTYFKTKNSACSLKKLENLEQKIDILKISIKSADVGHAAKTRDLHKKWSYLIIEEFFTQGDIEKTRNQPISMYCDRNNTDIPKSQAGFLKNIVLPLYECLSVILASEKIEESCVKEIKSNLAAWEYESNKTRFKTTMMMEEIVITDTTDVKQERTVRRFGTSRPFLDPGKSSWD